MMRQARWAVAALVMLLLATLWPGAGVRAVSQGPLVLAAASLQESLSEAADAWAARGHPRPVLSFAASSALARQIEAGAPADLFVSADEAWMDDVAAKGLIQRGSRVSLLGNRLVLVAAKGQTTRLTIARGFPLARALGVDGRLAMADPDSVPAGRYGKAALTALGVWPAVETKVARADNVRAALALVERGAAAYGIVYATDALAAPAVRVVGVFPAASHPPITYPLALLTSATHPDAASFRAFLLSPAAKAIFRRRGFTAR